ncbi:unnamed protein product [Ilex paraguariensis]|uniref:BAG domain-containing protein n=1 Tax=Ilex paraguariensis TaxID=185542 RepID=A0ABC8V1I6_9AQUA
MTTGLSTMNGSSGGADSGRNAGGGGGRDNGREWEMRPGGMLVQKRGPDSDHNRVPPPPTIRVRVKYGSTYHEINISSQATFGLSTINGSSGGADSGRNAGGGGGRDNGREWEMRPGGMLVSALETVISRGGKVAENEMLKLTELLMNQLVKLDGIYTDGDVKLQRKMQVKRVQKYVETLDMLKIKNSTPSSNGNHIPMQQQQKPSAIQQQQQQQQKHSNGHTPSPIHQQQARHSFGILPTTPQQHQQVPQRHSTSGPVVITTQWETFDSAPAPLPAQPSTSTTASSTNSIHPKFNWDLL